MTPTPLPDDLYTKLRAFLLAIVGAGVEVIQGLGNGVTLPAGQFVAMTMLLQQRLATNQDTYSDVDPLAGTRTVSKSTRLDVQLDFYGPNAASWADAASMLLRDDYGCDALAPVAAPLHADDAMQVPFVSGEEIYVSRWKVAAVLQYTAAITLPQQFAAELSADLINVDERYPP